ncbi:MAG: hypothetical protein OXE96_04145 [Gemmatimonadetes bacterium]|nr:hypothetical protein [Gemmatimonadota bacterium]
MRIESSHRTSRFALSTLVTAALLASLAVIGAQSVTGPGPEAKTAAGPPSSAPDTVSFAEDILPIFQQRCAKCHGAADENGDVRTEVSLNLLEYEKIMAGSEFGTVIEAGDPANSFLLDMIVDGTMPEEGDPVPEEEIALIRTWIEEGAPNN